jgi:hypothetical protein
VLTSRPSHHERTVLHGAAADSGAHYKRSAGLAPTPLAPFSVPSGPRRVQRYTATLSLREPTQAALSSATRRALAVAAAFGGHDRSVHVTQGNAQLVLAIPRQNVQAAVARLSRLGTITGESVDVQDLQPTVNMLERTIARLQRQLRTLRAQPPTDATKRAIDALTARVQVLQRRDAATRRAAHFATVSLTLTTAHPAAVHKQGHGPLHGLGVAFRWIGIGLVYGLALGAPLAVLVLLLWLLARWVRRRREDALLSRA